MKEVKVFWEDSKAYGNEWYDVEEVEHFDIVHCVSKGFIVQEDKQKIKLAQTFGGDCYLNFVIIPKGCITKLIVETDLT